MRCDASNSRRTLILENPPSLRDLKLRAQELEACENRVSGRTGDLRNNLASIKPNEKNNVSSNQFAKSVRNNNAPTERNSGVTSAYVECFNCHQPGHKRNSCPQLASMKPKHSSDGQNNNNTPNDRNNVAMLRNDASSTMRRDPREADFVSIVASQVTFRLNAVSHGNAANIRTTTINVEDRKQRQRIICSKLRRSSRPMILMLDSHTKLLPSTCRMLAHRTRFDIILLTEAENQPQCSREDAPPVLQHGVATQSATGYQQQQSGTGYQQQQQAAQSASTTSCSHPNHDAIARCVDEWSDSDLDDDEVAVARRALDNSIQSEDSDCPFEDAIAVCDATLSEVSITCEQTEVVGDRWYGATSTPYAPRKRKHTLGRMRSRHTHTLGRMALDIRVHWVERHLRTYTYKYTRTYQTSYQ